MQTPPQTWSIANDISLWHHRNKDRRILSTAFDRSVDSIVNRLNELRDPHHVSLQRLACNLKYDEEFIRYLRDLKHVDNNAMNHNDDDEGGFNGVGVGSDGTNNVNLYRIVMNEKRYIPTVEQLLISQRCLQYSAVAGLKLRVVARAGTGKGDIHMITSHAVHFV